MKTKFTADEKKLINHAKKMVVKFNKMRDSKGGIDTLYSFLMADSGKIYDGACLESNIGSGTVCAERHAIANMVMTESYATKIKVILIADPVPKVQKDGTPPCGTCRQLIWEKGTPNTIILMMQYIRNGKKWTFPKIQKTTIKKLYPKPYIPIEWD